MVIIDGEKYACERCIRGHRVSTCAHEDSPLIRIKPKGRPATQCQHCRENRKNGNLHTKCTCKSKNRGSCQCQVTSKCTCSSKAKARIDPVPEFQRRVAKTSPSPIDTGIDDEIGLAAFNTHNARSSPFETWYPQTAEAYNRLPDFVPTFGYEDETAPLEHAKEFVMRMSRQQSTESDTLPTTPPNAPNRLVADNRNVTELKQQHKAANQEFSFNGAWY